MDRFYSLPKDSAPVSTALPPIKLGLTPSRSERSSAKSGVENCVNPPPDGAGAGRLCDLLRGCPDTTQQQPVEARG
jgi:hypothetical protein